MANAKQPKRPRVPVPKSEIETHLERQLWLLQKSCSAYDEGDRDEYGRIATAVRVIAYDQGQSRSLLSQLDIKDIPFISYAYSISDTNLLSDAAVVMWQFGANGNRTLPALDSNLPDLHYLSFEDWWNEHLIRLADDERLSRGQAILIAANQDGGAHVDPEIDAVFHRVARLNEAGMQMLAPDGTATDLADVEKATVRHVGYELLRSVETALARRAGNNGCQCGSGRKFRYCCGKAPKSA